MVEPLNGKEVDDAAMDAGLGVAGAVDQASNARLQQCAGTHHARLEGHEQLAAGQAVVAQIARSIAQGGNFGVRRRIMVADRRIEATANDDPSRTTSAPTGTSPRHSAASAREIASRMKNSSFIDHILLQHQNHVKAMPGMGH
jgi:hypothetical protein